MGASHWLDVRLGEETGDAANKALILVGTGGAVQQATRQLEALIATCGSLLVALPVDTSNDNTSMSRALRQLEEKYNVSVDINKEAKEMPEAMKEALEASVGHALDVTISGLEGPSLNAARGEALGIAKDFLQQVHKRSRSAQQRHRHRSHWRSRS